MHLYKIQALKIHKGNGNIDSYRVCLMVIRWAVISQEKLGTQILCCFQVLFMALREAVG